MVVGILKRCRIHLTVTAATRLLPLKITLLFLAYLFRFFSQHLLHTLDLLPERYVFVTEPVDVRLRAIHV